MKYPHRIGMDVRYLGTCPSTGRADWQLREDMRIFGERVPNGFLTDGGSIPLIFAWFLNPTGRGFPAFVLHDLRYTDHAIHRAAADAELRRNMRALGCGRMHAWVAWAVIRLFGRAHWNA